MDIFSNLTPTMQVILVAIFILGLVILVGVVIAQQLRIRGLKESNKPKFGFLGKPLVAVLLLAGLAGIIGLTQVATQNTEDVSVSADEENLSITINSEVKSQVGEKYVVDLQVTPSLDYIAWGGDDAKKFDVFWEITGPETIDEAQLGASRDKPAIYTANLQPGDYQVEVNVMYDDVTKSKSIELQVP